METTGTNPFQDDIITLQFQALKFGAPVGNFNVMTIKEYGSEEELLAEFLNNIITVSKPYYRLHWTFMQTGSPFIPVGDNVMFELAFIFSKIYRYKLLGTGTKSTFYPNDFLNLRYVNLKPLLLLLNDEKGKDMFVGYSDFLHWRAIHQNYEIPRLYREGNWDEILKYIIEEKERFCELYSALKKRMPRLKREILPHLSWAGLDLKTAKIISKIMVATITPACKKIEVVGSIRRKKDFVHDIDIVAIPKIGSKKIISILEEMDGFEGIESAGEGFISFHYKGELVNIFLAKQKTWAFTKLIRTGSKDFNIANYTLAKERGVNLAEIEAQEERDIFEALGVKFVPPERR